MKDPKTAFTLILSFLLLLSCKDKPKDETRETSEAGAEIAKLENNFRDWWNYQYNTIDLSSEFTAIDENEEELGREAFLEKLTSGEYIPVEVNPDADPDQYQLHRLDQAADKEIQKGIIRLSKEELANFRKLGTKFPDFEFQDLQGRRYTNEELKGKTIIIKTWFINCKPCIEEFPVLNELVESYEASEEVVFISLALDPKEDLEKFLAEKPFNYKVIPDQVAFIRDVLEVSKYPTHIVVDKNGNYQSIPGNAQKLLAFLGASDIKVEQDSDLPAPPPPPPGPGK